MGAHSCPSGMVPIPAGEFQMGVPSATDDRGPAHTEAVAAFCIDRLEVTTADYRACVARGGCTPTGGSSTCNEPGTERGQHPINCVSHPQAEAYCRQRGARLPTEAEWEYAARGTDGRRYPWGNAPPTRSRAWSSLGGRLQTHTAPVGQRRAGASPFGVEDMAGNVREWTADYFVAYPGQAADADAFFGEENRVNRGGGWFDGEDGELVTTYNRNAGPPGTSANDDIGFRCARDAEG